jgi:hypothetical protein
MYNDRLAHGQAKREMDLAEQKSLLAGKLVRLSLKRLRARKLFLLLR